MWQYYTGVAETAQDVDVQVLRGMAKEHRAARGGARARGARRVSTDTESEGDDAFMAEMEDTSNEGDSVDTRLPHLRTVPVPATLFKAELEAWLREQCESVGCEGVVVNIASLPNDPLAWADQTPPHKKVKLAARGPRRSAGRDHQIAGGADAMASAAQRACPLCGTGRGYLCGATGISHDGLFPPVARHRGHPPPPAIAGGGGPEARAVADTGGAPTNTTSSSSSSSNSSTASGAGDDTTHETTRIHDFLASIAEDLAGGMPTAPPMPFRSGRGTGSSGAVDVQVDEPLATAVSHRNGVPSGALTRTAGYIGTIPATGRLSAPCGNLQRSQLDPTSNRHVYRVHAAGRDSNMVWVPPAFLRARRERERGPSRDRRAAVDAGTAPPEAVELLVHAAGGAGDVLLAAVDVALSKTTFFMRMAVDLPEGIRTNLPLLAAAVRARFPDTALLWKEAHGVVLFCACGVGAALVPEWLPHAAAVRVGTHGVPDAPLAGVVRAATGCGIATSRPTAKRFPQWEMQTTAESREQPAGVYKSLPPADSHVLEAAFQEAQASAAPGAHVRCTPLSLDRKAVYRIDTKQHTLGKAGSGAPPAVPVRRVRPLVMIEDIRKGDLVRLVPEAVGGGVSDRVLPFGRGVSGAGRAFEPRPGDVGDVVEVEGGACTVRFRGTHTWRGDVARVERLDIRELDRVEDSSAPVQAVVFGPPSAVSEAAALVKAHCHHRRTSFLLPPATAHVFHDKVDDIRLAAKVEHLEVRSRRIVVRGTPSAIESARKLVNQTLVDYAVALQRWRLDDVRARARESLTRTVRPFAKHEGLAAVFSKGDMFNHGTQGGVVPKSAPVTGSAGGASTSAQGPPAAERPTVIRIDRQGNVLSAGPAPATPVGHPASAARGGAAGSARSTRQAEEEYAGEAVVLWSNFDDFAERVKRDVNAGVGAADDLWSLPTAQVGVRKGGQLTVNLADSHPSSKTRCIGDKVELRDELFDTKLKYVGVKRGEVGTVQEVDGGTLRVSFPSNASWRVDAADVQPHRQRVAYVVKSVDVGLDGGAEDTGGLRFARAVTKWLRHVAEGGDDQGRPTTVTIALTGQGSTTGATSLRLQCPSDAGFTVDGAWGPQEDTLEHRVQHAAMRAIRLKWLSLIDDYLIQELHKHVQGPTAVARAVKKISELLADATDDASALSSEVAALRQQCRTAPKITRGKQVYVERERPDGGYGVAFVDTDGDDNILDIAADGTCYYTPVGQGERKEVKRVKYATAGRMLSVTLDPTEWRMALPCDRGLLLAIARLCNKAPEGTLEHNLHDVDADGRTALDVQAAVDKLDSMVTELSNDWRDGLAAALFTYQVKQAKARQDAMDCLKYPRAAAALLFKERLEALTGAYLAPAEGFVSGTEEAVARAQALIDASILDVGASNTVEVPVDASVAGMLRDNEAALLVMVKGVTGLEDMSLREGTRPRAGRGAVVSFTGARGAVERALQLLGLDGADAIAARGPDARALTAGASGCDVDMPSDDGDGAMGDAEEIAVYCCGRHSAAGDVPRLSCGHRVHPACVVSGTALRCPLCEELLNMAEIRAHAEWYNARPECEAPVRVLQLLSAQVNAAMEGAEGVCRCGACGEWMYSGTDIPCVVCAHCLTEHRRGTTVPPSTVLSGTLGPLSPPTRAGDPRGRVLPLCATEVACARCGASHFPAGAMCTATACYTTLLCDGCTIRGCPNDAIFHTLEPVAFECTYDAAERCPLGHRMVEAPGRACERCRGPPRGDRLTLACSVCEATTCAACNVAQHTPVLAVMDNAFFTRAGVPRGAVVAGDAQRARGPRPGDDPASLRLLTALLDSGSDGDDAGGMMGLLSRSMFLSSIRSGGRGAGGGGGAGAGGPSGGGGGGALVGGRSTLAQLLSQLY